MYKVLFHLNEKDKVEGALRNIENLLEDIKENIKVLLVVHSEAVHSFKLNEHIYKDEIQMLLNKGVSISVCKNTLENLNLKKEDFPSEFLIASSTAGEIVRKQQEGWLYIKP